MTVCSSPLLHALTPDHPRAHLFFICILCIYTYTSHTHIHTSIHSQAHTHTHANTHACKHTHINSRTHAHKRTHTREQPHTQCLYIAVHAYMCMCVGASVCGFVRVCWCVCSCACMRVIMHVRVSACRFVHWRTCVLGVVCVSEREYMISLHQSTFLKGAAGTCIYTPTHASTHIHTHTHKQT